MAIRGHGYWGHTTGSYFADASLEGYGPGTALVLMDGTAATGKAGDSNNLVGPSLGTSGELFVGVLRSTVYAWDKTKSCFNPAKYQSAATQCTPVNTQQKGTLTLDATNFTLSGTPTAEAPLYLGPNGTFADGGLTEVGVFAGVADSDGRYTIRIDE